MRPHGIPIHHIVHRASLPELPEKASRSPKSTDLSHPTSVDADLDVVVTATQIRIRGLLGLFWFLCSVRRVKSQLTGTDGLLFARFHGTRTLTGWRSEEAMRAFRNSGAHLEAMRSLRKIGQAKSATWRVHEAPDWPTVESKLSAVKFRPRPPA